MTFIIGEKREYGWHVYSTCWGSKLSIAQTESKEGAIEEAIKILQKLGFVAKVMDYNTEKKFRFSYF